MSTAKVRVCPCGHEERWHAVNVKDKSGPRGACNYGHDHAMGGCDCPKFHSRRWGSPSTRGAPPPPASLVEAFERMKTRVGKAMGDFQNVLDAKTPLERASFLDLPSSTYGDRFMATGEIVATHETVEPPRSKKDPLPARENGEWKPGRCELALLSMLGRRRPQPTRFKQLAVMTEYRSGSGSYKNALSALRGRGLIDGPRTALRITPTGLRLFPVEALPVGRELLHFWWPKLNKCERAIATELYGASPGGYSKANLAEITGYALTSGGFKNALSHLRTLELIRGSDVLFVTDAVRGIASADAVGA